MKEKNYYGVIKLFLCSLLSGLLFLEGTFLHAAFKDPGYGARPAGMGDAFVAISDDTNALLFNPAGATQASSKQFSFNYAQPFIGLDDVNVKMNFASLLYPYSDIVTLGIGYAALTEDSFEQSAITVSGATSLNRWLSDLPMAISVGVNFHTVKQEFNLDVRTQNDSVFSKGNDSSAPAFDVGVWMKPDPKTLPGLSLGFVGKYLNEPDLGLVTEDKVVRQLIGGLAYDWRRITLVSDFVKRDTENEWRAGIEYWSKRRSFGLRAGFNPNALSTGLSFNIRQRMFFDYAYSLSVNLDETSGAHRAAFGFNF